MPPIHWNDIDIDYRYGMFAINDSDSICFYYYRDTTDGVCIKKMMFDITDYENEGKMKWGKINISKFIFNNHSALLVEKVEKNSNNYYNIIYIPDKKIAIGYLGLEENYSSYKEFIYNIKITDCTK